MGAGDLAARVGCGAKLFSPTGERATDSWSEHRPLLSSQRLHGVEAEAFTAVKPLEEDRASSFVNQTAISPFRSSLSMGMEHATSVVAARSDGYWLSWAR